jgi:uncharacterized membrane protein
MKLLLISVVILLTLDLLFLYANQTMFQKQVALVQRSPLRLRMASAVACYILLIFGLYYFILLPKRPIVDAVFLGLIIYGVYETTTYALLTNWSLNTVLIDTLWGGALLGLTTAFTYKLV